jgi:hypothetical protein
MSVSQYFLKNNADMIVATARCIELCQFMPALVLMYSHIDTLAWSGSTKKKGSTRRNFESWVSKWLLPELAAKAPQVSATDLYAARCGVLHSLTSKSNLTNAGAAREIAYAWGDANAATLGSDLAASPLSNKLVTLHYEDLFNGLRKAIAKFMEAAEADPALMTYLEEAAGQHYMNIPTSRPRDPK